MLNLAVRPYYRPFRKPLQTHHGLWEKREGLIVRLQDDEGRVGLGEIAPIPWFGTETLDEAKDFCSGWSQPFLPEAIATIPNTFPACQFGFGSALRFRDQVPLAARDRFPLAGCNDPVGNIPEEPGPLVCALLPTGAAALHAWSSLWQKGHRTFKWKIGVTSLQEELSLFRALVNALPSNAYLRLDANGGLTPNTANQWLTACDAAHGKVEFLEQPLPPDHILDWVVQASDTFQTAIALDESVATLKQLQQVYQQLQSRVVYVVKPAIAGFPEKLRTLCTQHRLDVVFSSALETPIGRQATLNLAQELWAVGISRRALGFGVGHWFQDDWDILSEADLWQQL
ncbi:MAG: o-succinylbenzoate synthase [Cyanobacteria bacterium J06626_18]